MVSAPKPLASSRDLLAIATLVAVGSLAVGFLLLGAYCLAESVASNISPVDAYWRGRLPWMGWIEGLIVAGATATIVAGGFVSLVRGGWWRRLALVPLAGVAGLWWLAALYAVGVNYAPCPGCPTATPDPDPWAYAYSIPETAFLFLVVPALAITALALVPRHPSATGAVTGG